MIISFFQLRKVSWGYECHWNDYQINKWHWINYKAEHFICLIKFMTMYRQMQKRRSRERWWYGDAKLFNCLSNQYDPEETSIHFASSYSQVYFQCLFNDIIRCLQQRKSQACYWTLYIQRLHYIGTHMYP